MKLVLRSHEGPDARYDRSDMPSMQQGWTLDHKVEAGRLLTVFRSKLQDPALFKLLHASAEILET